MKRYFSWYEKIDILSGRHYENTRNTKTESQMPSFRIVIGLPSKEILVLKKMTIQPLLVALRPSAEWKSCV